jgi:V8-like Glu-specific endopeptidase
MNIFKKIMASVVALTFGMCAVSSTVSASMNSTYRKGDVDGDGYVDNSDSAYLNNFLSGHIASPNDQVSQRLDVDLSGIIDQHDKAMLSNMISNGSNPVYLAYEDSSYGSGVPAQSSSAIYYRKYNATNGVLVATNGTYSLSPLNNISTSSIDEPEIMRSGTDYSNKGIVGLNFMKNGVGFAGTGIIIGSNKILTAAHCMFDTKFNFPAYNVTVDVYDGVGNTPNTYSAVNYHIPQAYYDASDYTPVNDYAIITVSTPFQDNYIMNLGVARDILKANQPSSVYVNTLDGTLSKLCVFVTGRWAQMWTEEGFLKSGYGNDIMNHDVINFSTWTYGGQSGGPAYVETEEEEKTVIAIQSGKTQTYSVGQRINTDVLHFAFNNPYL